MSLLKPDELEDIQTRLQKYVIDSESDKNSVSFNVAELLEDPILNSGFSETLRLQVNGLSTRGVDCDTTITVDGYPYVLEKGSTVFCSMPGVHKDPEIYDEPEKFRLKRFIQLHTKGGEVDSRMAPFTKRGIPLRYPFLPWGGGVHMVSLLTSHTKFSIVHRTEIRDWRGPPIRRQYSSSL